MRRFLWAGKDKDRFHALVSWNWVTSDKNFGGLGVRDLRLMNTALLGKLIWSMLYENHKPWVQVFSSKYLKSGSMLNAFLVPNCSPTWRSVVLALQELRDGFSPRLNDGTSSLWFVDWMGQGLLCDMVDYVHISDTLLQVRDIATEDGWDVSNLYTILPQGVRDQISGIPSPTFLPAPDCFVWKGSSSGIYSCRSAYNWLKGPTILLQDASNLRWSLCEDISMPHLPHSFGSSAVRLSMDGSWFPDRSRLGFGGFIRDYSGRLVIGFSGGRNSGDACLAELLAVFKGLSLAWDLGYRHILCEIDSQEVYHSLLQRDVSHLHSHTNCLTNIFSLVDQESFLGCLFLSY
ncbi:Ribonuclease H-like superfamily [Sesbania bispinosa]|nr:Ribonuclease H-like superfamily [Sesbania bispinosa]